MKGWKKIDVGWYEGPNGEVIQFWRRLVCPWGNTGWYLWLKEDLDDKPKGPFKTIKKAIQKINEPFGGVKDEL